MNNELRMVDTNYAKSFRAMLSPRSLLFLSVGGWLSWLCILRPSLAEVGLVLIVDQIALGLSMAFRSWAFGKFYPRSANLSQGVDWDAVAKLDFAGRLEYFRALIDYPHDITVFATVLNPIKMLPAMALMIFYWHNDGLITQAVVVGAGAIIIIAFMYAALFIENHLLVTRIINDIHQRFDWRDVFEASPVQYQPHDFTHHERVALTCMALAAIAVQWTLITRPNEATPSYLALETISIWVTLFILGMRVWWQSRSLFMGGLESIFAAFERFDPRQDLDFSLAVGSSALVGSFALTFNRLMQRLRSYERELSHWIFVKADEHRFQALGEIAGLIAHDLSSPIHSMAFCAEQLAETPELAKDPRYMQTLLVSAERMSDLVTSLRSYLTITTPDDAASQMATAMTQVLRLLGIQFRRDGFAAIDIALDPQLSQVTLRIRQADLIHILINLLSNSVKNLLENHIAEPTIAIALAAIDDDWVTIHIRDNGTGLSLESFERLTAFAFQPSTPTVQQGLGLRLIRRLAERAGGSLSLVPPSNKAGSIMALRLRHAVDTPQAQDPATNGATFRA